MSTAEKNDYPGSTQVDLGLEELIKGGAQTHKEEVALPPAESPAPEIEGIDFGPFADLARKGQWGELITFCELIIRTHGAELQSAQLQTAELPSNGAEQQASEAVPAETQRLLNAKQEAQSWWLWAQRIRDGVPASILAGPLDTLAESVLATLGSSNGQTVPEATVKKQALEPRDELAIRLLVRALQDIAVVMSDTEADMSRHCEQHATALKVLLPATVAAGVAAFFTLGAKSLAGAVATPVPPQADSKVDETSNSTNEGVNPAPQPIAAATAEQSDAALAELNEWRPLTPPPTIGRPERRVAGGGLGRLLGFGLPALALLGVLGWWWSVRLAGSGDSGSVLIDTVIPDQVAALQPPTIERSAFRSALDLMYYEVGGEAGPQSPSASPATIPPRESAPAAVVGTDAPAVVAAKKVPAPVVEKIVIDTSGPIEPQDLKAEVRVTPNAYPTAYITRRELPRKDTSVDAPKTQERSSVAIGTTAGFYRVLVSTEVMAKPSSVSAPMAILRRGDRIRVEQVTGNWLKLASKSGKAGYVKQQDVIKE